MRKNEILYYLFLFLLFTGCTQKSKQQNNNLSESTISTSLGKKNTLALIDMRKQYPEKEIILQDIADVSYIALESNEEFPFNGKVVALEKDKIIAYNFRDGNIFFHSGNGKFEKIINRQGGGPEEYAHIGGLAYHGSKNELFVNDIRGYKILVYDSNGKFKRAFKHLPKTRYRDICCFKDELLVCDDLYRPRNSSTFFTISKKDGSLIRNISSPIANRIEPMIAIIHDKWNQTPVNFHYDSKCFSDMGIVLNCLSSDTIYEYSQESKRLPLVTRIPSVQSMTPAVVLVADGKINQYLFLHSMKLELVKKDNSVSGYSFDTKSYVYDGLQGKVFTPILYNTDYAVKKDRSLPTSINNGIMINQIPAYKLVDLYNKGELKGKLDKIASKLDINDAPVIMMVKYKK